MLAGELLAERFELLEEVQKGGMGTIFRARDRTTGRTVAVKVLRQAGEEDVARFAHAAALEANGQAEEAARELAIARERLRERAARIQDPSWRRSFLENVPENVALLGGSNGPG